MFPPWPCVIECVETRWMKQLQQNRLNKPSKPFSLKLRARQNRMTVNQMMGRDKDQVHNGEDRRNNQFSRKLPENIQLQRAAILIWMKHHRFRQPTTSRCD